MAGAARGKRERERELASLGLLCTACKSLLLRGSYHQPFQRCLLGAPGGGLAFRGTVVSVCTGPFSMTFGSQERYVFQNSRPPRRDLQSTQAAVRASVRPDNLKIYEAHAAQRNRQSCPVSCLESLACTPLYIVYMCNVDIQKIDISTYLNIQSEDG